MGQACSRRSQVFIRDVPSFNTFPRPGCFPEKREAGFHARVVEKTADRDATTHLSPPIPFDQVLDDGLQRYPVQWIARMGSTHGGIPNGIGLMTEDKRLIASSLLNQMATHTSPTRNPAGGYVLRLRSSAKRAKGVKVEGGSCVRPDGGSAGGSAT